MTSFKLDAVAPRALPHPSAQSTAESTSSFGHAAPKNPTLLAVIRRGGLPLIMLLIVGGTPLWGGYVTLGLALVTWRLAGVLL